MADNMQVQISEVDVGDKQKINQIRSESESPIIYRPDIDGLRAIAVSIVVLFHAWPFLIPGGFVGVDIFFVISGYLITQIILKQNVKGTFSYLQFYNRRIKRIFPALLVVLIFVLIISVFRLSLMHLIITAKTLIASSLFGTNIFLMLYERNYFDPDAKSNPLLHLWSLGIEEQFYIFWPFMICLLANKFSSKIFHFLSTFTLLLFISNIIASNINPKFDFYFPFCRFWQMAIGGLLAVKSIQISKKDIANKISFVGIIMIFASAFLLNEKKLFPGWWSLFPTLGSAFIIQAGPQSYVNTKILSTKQMVFIGKISYSLYLWHWPLLNLSRILYPRGSTSIFAYTIVILILSVFLSAASYYYIENPLRYSKKKFISILLLLSMLLLSASAFYIKENSLNIFISRLNHQIAKQIEQDMIPQQQDYIIKNGRRHPNSSKNKVRSLPNATKIRYAYQLNQVFGIQKLLDKKIDKSSKFYREHIPRLVTHYQVSNEGKQNLFLFVSDSYGNVGARFQKLYEEAVMGNKTEQFPTIVSIVAPGANLLHLQIQRFAMQWIQEFKPKRILFIYQMDYYFDDPQLEQIVELYVKLIKPLTQKGIQVAISTLRPRGSEYDPANMLDINGVIERNVKPANFTWWRQFFGQTIQFFESELQKAGAEIIDYCLNQCWDEVCEVLSPRGQNLYTDAAHFTHLYCRYWMSAADHLVEF